MYYEILKKLSELELYFFISYCIVGQNRTEFHFKFNISIPVHLIMFSKLKKKLRCIPVKKVSPSPHGGLRGEVENGCYTQNFNPFCWVKRDFAYKSKSC